MKPLVVLALFAISLLVTGCVATKNQFAAADRQPAVTLDLRPAQSPVDIHLDAIVSRGAPGSWKRDALWDEYDLFLANRTDRKWQVESVHLVAAPHRIVQPGTDPWELERLTANWLRETGVDAARDVVWGVGQAANVVAGTVAGAGLVVLQLGGAARPDTAFQVLGIMTAAATVPKVLQAPSEANAKSKDEVADEFQRRRKALLASLPPGREMRGSAFFPITPEARQLVLVCRSDTEVRIVTIQLPAARDPATNEFAAGESRDLRIVPASLSP